MKERANLNDRLIDPTLLRPNRPCMSALVVPVTTVFNLSFPFRVLLWRRARERPARASAADVTLTAGEVGGVANRMRLGLRGGYEPEARVDEPSALSDARVAEG